MDTTSRFLIASFIAAAVAGCNKDADPTPAANAAPQPATAAPAQPPAAAAPAAPAPSDAYRWEVHKATNIKFELPTAWTVAQQGDVLVAKTPTPGVGLEFAAASGGLVARNDEKAMLVEVGKTLQGARFTSPPKAVQQHGLKGFVATGTGTKDGAEVEWFTSALGDGRGHAMLTVGFWAPGAAPAYKAQMVHVMDSIQPAR
jgi:hypothetical protein